MAIKLIALTFGYVESGTTARLLFSAGNPPKTKREAIKSLAEYFYQKYLIDNRAIIEPIMGSPCCQNYIGKENFCPKCGKDLTSVIATDNYLSWQDFIDFLFEVFHSDANSFGEYDSFPNPNDWTPWGVSYVATEKQVIDIPENGEHILAIALNDLHPEFHYEISDIAREFIIHDYEVLFK